MISPTGLSVEREGSQSQEQSQASTSRWRRREEAETWTGREQPGSEEGNQECVGSGNLSEDSTSRGRESDHKSVARELTTGFGNVSITAILTHRFDSIRWV